MHGPSLSIPAQVGRARGSRKSVVDLQFEFSAARRFPLAEATTGQPQADSHDILASGRPRRHATERGVPRYRRRSDSLDCDEGLHTAPCHDEVISPMVQQSRRGTAHLPI